MVVRRSAARRSGGRRQRLQPRERGDELLGPRPVFRESEDRAPRVAGDPPGLVKEPVAQPLELPRARLTGQAQLSGPGDQVLGELHEPQPHLVVRKRPEREV
jgi:hypothetical protein